MARTSKRSAGALVIPLHPPTLAAPNPRRVEAIRRWLIDKAIADQHPIAALSIVVTADGSIISESIGVDGDTGLIDFLLQALDDARADYEAALRDISARPSMVVPFKGVRHV